MPLKTYNNLIYQNFLTHSKFEESYLLLKMSSSSAGTVVVSSQTSFNFCIFGINIRWTRPFLLAMIAQRGRRRTLVRSIGSIFVGLDFSIFGSTFWYLCISRGWTRELEKLLEVRGSDWLSDGQEIGKLPKSSLRGHFTFHMGSLCKSRLSGWGQDLVHQNPYF